MKVRILRSALEDLAVGRRFYDRQEQGVGEYFYDSLFAEIDSLVLYAGVHPIRFGFHRLLARRFPYAVYYRVIGTMPWCSVFWIVAVTHDGFERSLGEAVEG